MTVECPKTCLNRLSEWCVVHRPAEPPIRDRRLRVGEAVCMDPRMVVAATIESLLWAIEGDQRQEFSHTARDVRAMERGALCCALCDEVICDDICPLANWRAAQEGDVPVDPVLSWFAARLAAVEDKREAEEDRANENATLVHQARAELADLRDRITALADKWSGCWCDEQQSPDHDPRVQDCPQHGDGSCQHMAEGVTVDLRATIADL